MKLIPVVASDVGFIATEERKAARWPWSEKLLLQSIDAGHQCLAVHVNDTMVGYCVLMNNSEALEILNLVVFDGYQRQGIARKLLGAIKQQAASSKLPAVWLEVRQDNLAAFKLYQSEGFMEQGRRTGYYRSTNPRSGVKQPVDAILMSRPVNLLPP